MEDNLKNEKSEYLSNSATSKLDWGWAQLNLKLIFEWNNHKI